MARVNKKKYKVLVSFVDLESCVSYTKGQVISLNKTQLNKFNNFVELFVEEV